MPRVTSTRRSLCHSSSGSRQGRSRKSGFPGRTSIWKPVPRSRYATLAAWESVSGDDLDASRAGRRMSSGVCAKRFPRRPAADPRGRLDMTPLPDHSTIAQRLPDGLGPLARLARNLAWTWDEQIAAVLGEVDPEGLIAASGNPVAMLAAVPRDRLDALAGDAGFRERLARAEARLDGRLGAPSWYAHAARGPRRDRLLLAGVRAQRGAAPVLRRARHPGRRPPQGRQRSRRPDRRHRALLPQRLLPPAAHGGRRPAGGVRRARPGAAADDACARRRRRARCDLDAAAGRDPARRALARRRRPGAAAPARRGRAMRTRPPSARSPTASTAATASTGCARRSCSASAASRRSRPAASSRPSST